ncbi:1,2-phenylacetyl-CoA epoxidase subunit PaaD [Kocuria sp. HSID16901]|uniref:1,2-phenylacetyl-CoA epoxidase subunit PaaD n=1 Tax=Kocuria sp. HSID16901 TaxID=2419505 RepID=UPI0009E64DDA|nr:1,2-phenylacetyl-CoA epoxidase subunit PaaD [Kocuria sp. HSID16901]MCT1368159.1 phenylacetate-CoA oxygenase subunit PaaJ [Rothia sp. p3-SID1597]RUQ20641.1 phenylacetate-CoA oxygenase subunit PaaJ [Kocuria sp. HSID16901]
MPTTFNTAPDQQAAHLDRPLPLGPSKRPADPADAALWDLAATVCDPEIPVLTLADLGVLRDAYVDGRGAIVVITPTYSGCPAMDAMAEDIVAVLSHAGYEQIRIEKVLRPAWTTDWMSPDGRDKLTEYGIAPPSGDSAPGHHSGPVRLSLSVKCPHCGSLKTREMTRFGSTSCKALWVCSECLEPFDYFKVH